MQPFTVDDLYLHQKIEDLHGVPFADAAFGTVQSVNKTDNRYTSNVWCFPLNGEPKPFTQGSGLDKSPRLSPDGRQLAFLSDRAGLSQLFVMDRDGGEAAQLAFFEKGASSFRWSPDGQTLYVAAAVSVDPNRRGERDARQDTQDADAPEVCWRLPYKSDGVGFLLRREIHLFSVNVQSAEKKQLTDGAFDVMGFEPSPEGKHLAYTRTREGRYAHCTDLWVCDVSGNRHRRMTREHATVMQPAWSPDGRWIAFSGAVKEGDSETRLWLLEFVNGKVRQIGADLEVADPESLQWSDSGDALALVRAYRGRHDAGWVTIADGTYKPSVSGNRQLGAFAIASGCLVYSVHTPVSACELWACDADGRNERQISDLNPWWKDRTPLQLEARFFDVPDGQGGRETIEGWLLRAKGREGPVPLLMDMHGGPASYALLDFDTNAYWQALCSRGWAVLLLNAVGSSSFGGDFCERLSGHWGELDLPQHLEAIRQLQMEKVCDSRLAVAGKSYGGFLTSWAIGHTDVFSAAVVMAPVGNVETHYGTSDGGYYAEPLYIGTAPRFDRQRARELSPLQSIENAATPTLFLQGKDDERCPKCQSEELFVSLYRAGHTPAELVLYPNEGHTFLGEGKPACRADACRRIMDWLTDYTVDAALDRGALSLKTLEHDDEVGVKEMHAGHAPAGKRAHTGKSGRA